jgi:predicted N-acetyltransferase YhbS
MENALPIALQRANESEIDEVLQLIRSLSAWLRGKGIHQWSDSFPRQILESEVADGELFVLKESGKVIASVALTRSAGDLWDSQYEDSVFLHRLAVSRERSGLQLGRRIMTWAEQEARSQGARYLRLVCDVTNPFLPSYYQKLGYAPAGVKQYAPYCMDFARFEKNL